MKKFIAIIMLNMLGVIMFAQNNETSHVVKYEVHAPNGSVAVTVTDDSDKNGIEIKSVDTFYKYQILDKKTNEAVFTSENKGKECTVYKTNLKDGTYDLKLYTSNFVITTDLEILQLAEFNAILQDGEMVSLNN